MTIRSPYTNLDDLRADLSSNQPDNHLAAFRAAHDMVTRSIAARIRGEDAAIRWSLIASYCACHALIFGGPSSGKTTLITTVANNWRGASRYLRGANDTLASDLTGGDLPNVVAEKWWSIPGPLERLNFALVDEINRYSPGGLTALLDAMQQWAVTTASGEQRDLAWPFVIYAALNPNDRGTTPLGKATNDRFGLAFKMGSTLIAGPGKSGSRLRLDGGISDEDLAERIRSGAPVHWRAEARQTADSPFAPADLERIQLIVVNDIHVDQSLDLAIAQLWRITSEFGEKEIGLRAPEVHRAVAQAYAATDPAGARNLVTDADVRNTWRAVYCGRLEDSTYIDSITRLESKLFGDEGVFRFPKSAANTDSMRYVAPSRRR